MKWSVSKRPCPSYMRNPGRLRRKKKKRENREDELTLVSSGLLVNGNIVDLDLGICNDGQKAIVGGGRQVCTRTIVIGSVGDRVRAPTTAVVSGTGPVAANGDIYNH